MDITEADTSVSVKRHAPLLDIIYKHFVFLFSGILVKQFLINKFRIKSHTFLYKHIKAFNELKRVCNIT